MKHLNDLTDEELIEVFRSLLGTCRYHAACDCARSYAAETDERLSAYGAYETVKEEAADRGICIDPYID